MSNILTLKPKDILQAPYTRLVVPDEGGGYVAELLEFDGCFADGDTPAEAFRNLDKVARAWISERLDSGLPIPEPTGHAEMSGRFALRLPKSLHYKAAVYAEREGVSLNTFIVDAISGSVGVLDFVEKYAKPKMDVIWNQVNLMIFQIKGTYDTVTEIPVNQFPALNAKTLSLVGKNHE